MSVVHLSQWLQAHTSSSTTEDDVRIISAHAARCGTCRSLLASDEEIHRRLALLRVGEPRIDVLERVMQRVNEIEPN
jgi:hypothetical protein